MGLELNWKEIGNVFQIPTHIVNVHVTVSGDIPPLHLASSASPSFLGSHKTSAAPPHPTIDYQSILG